MICNSEWTVGRIAEELDISVFRTAYLIKSRQLKPISRAGRLRIFDANTVELLRQELNNRKLSIA